MHAQDLTARSEASRRLVTSPCAASLGHKTALNIVIRCSRPAAPFQASFANSAVYFSRASLREAPQHPAHAAPAGADATADKLDSVRPITTPAVEPPLTAPATTTPTTIQVGVTTLRVHVTAPQISCPSAMSEDDGACPASAALQTWTCLRTAERRCC